MSFKIEPADILVRKIIGNSPWDNIKKFAIGSPGEHAMMYMGGGLLYESIPSRGVVIDNIAYQLGQYVIVVRLGITEQEIDRVTNNALVIAQDVNSHYDHISIAEFLIPRLFIIRLGLGGLLPLKYQRNAMFICSEAVAEVFWRADIPVLPTDIEPMPWDFVELHPDRVVWEGILSEENI